jgi:hypothetical protein
VLIQLCTLLFTCFVSISLALFMFVLMFWWEFLQLLIVVGMHFMMIVYFWFLFLGDVDFVVILTWSLLAIVDCRKYCLNSVMLQYCIVTILQYFLLNSVSGNTCDLFKFWYTSNIVSLFDNIVLDSRTLHRAVRIR